MRKSVLLSACSATVLVLASQSALAQQTPAPALPDEATQVPPNSDAAEEVEARQNVVVEENADGDQDVIPLITSTTIATETDPVDTITVTGSRLRGGDQTNRLIVIDEKEIRDRGVQTVEELIRTLPENVATIGAITNDRSKGPLSSAAGNSGARVISDVGALGVSAANLGGVGAGNTLVLVNGRRIAGAAGIEAGYVNLNGIPLSAIERVEISTGGQAAIYGADALGGVINFILKKDYVGTTVSASHRITSSGAESSRASIYTGYAWGSGSVAGTVEFARSEPIVNAKTGYVTNNYAPFYDGKSQFDRRTFNAGTQPGTAIKPGAFDPATNKFTPSVGLTVPKGFVGAPTKADLIETTTSNARDYVPEFAGPASRSVSASLNFDQNITDRLRIFGTSLYNWSRNTQANAAFGGISLNLSPDQFYSPFDPFEFSRFSYGSTVYYFPGAEIADGTLVPGDVSNTSENWSATGGLSYDFGDLATLQIVATKSESSTEGSGQQLGNIVSFQRTVTNGVTTYPCYNFLLANNRIPENQRDAYKAAFDAQCAALTSSDPNVAFNPWKSTSDGGGADISTFLYPYVVDDLGSTLDNIEARLTGDAFQLPAGPLSYAMGAEYSRTGLKNTVVSQLAGPDPSSKRYAFFGEVNLPILGRDYTLPFARRLLFNIALRHDVTSSEGAIGTVDRIPVDLGGEIIYGKNSFGRTTPSWGMLWSPTNTIDVRVKFTRGFKAPPPSQLYSVQGTQQYLIGIADDPLYTCTSDCSRITSSGSRIYNVPATFSPNPDLLPETSRQQLYSISWQPTGPLSGLNLSATYNRNKISNQFATTRELFYYLPAIEVLKLPLFYPRDPVTNKITTFNNTRYNIIGSRYESLTLEASYFLSTDIGTFLPKITYVDNLVAETTALSDDQTLDQVGTILGVDRYKIVGSLQWNIDRVSTNLYVYHTPSYQNDYYSDYAAGVQVNPELIKRVDPLTTVDLSVSWVAKDWLNIQLSGRNIFKADAPFAVVGSLPYDTARYNVEGRSFMASARVTF